jgi:hypothetical protein
MRSLRIILITACLVADMATPLYPGAFRFDPAESIEGVGSRTSTARPPHTTPSPPGHEIPRTAWSRSLSSTGADLRARLPIRPMLPRATLASIPVDLGSPRSAEDA